MVDYSHHVVNLARECSYLSNKMVARDRLLVSRHLDPLLASIFLL